MKTRNKFQLFWLNRSNSLFKSKNGSFLCCVIGSAYNQKVFRQAFWLILNLKVSRQALWLILNLKVSRQALWLILNLKVSRQALWLILNLKVSRQAFRQILNQKVSRQAFQRICNPLSKNVRPLSPGDLQSPSSFFVFHSKTIARTTGSG